MAVAEAGTLSIYTPKRWAILAVVALASAVCLWPMPFWTTQRPVYAAAPLGAGLVVVSVFATIYMAAALGYDVWLVSHGIDLATNNSASFLLWKLGRRAMAFPWLNGLSTFAVGLWAAKLVFWCYLIFQTHLFFSITGLPAEKV